MKSFLIIILFTILNVQTFSQNCSNINIPEAPPFTDIEITFPEEDYHKLKKEEESEGLFSGCTDIYRLTGYILRINTQSDRSASGIPSICFKDEKGIVHDISFDDGSLCNADRSWLPYIMIPGGKVELSVYSCGNGGYETIVKIKNLKRIKKSVIVVPENRLTSDVDINIPISDYKNSNMFVVIIGNENYENEIDVEYAINDAKTFSKYVIKTLGVPIEQVHLIENASYANMLKEIEWLKRISKAYSGDAKIIFYYAGHGMPDTKSKAAYLLPVDGDAAQIVTSISLERLYLALNKYSNKKVTVFLDACFSGGAREGMLLAGRGVKIVPKVDKLNGNLVVFSAVTGNQTAHPYASKQHGLFSYYLMKKLQETKGNITYGQLEEYVRRNVIRKSVVYGREQTPQINVSFEVRNSWKNWIFR